MGKVLEYALGLTLAYVVASLVGDFVMQSFANAAANIEQARKGKP